MQQNVEKLYRRVHIKCFNSHLMNVTERYRQYCTENIVWRIKTRKPTKISKTNEMFVLNAQKNKLIKHNLK